METGPDTVMLPARSPCTPIESLYYSIYCDVTKIFTNIYIIAPAIRLRADLRRVLKTDCQLCRNPLAVLCVCLFEFINLLFGNKSHLNQIADGLSPGCFYDISVLRLLLQRKPINQPAQLETRFYLPG